MNGTAVLPSTKPCFHGSNISKNWSDRAFSVWVISHFQLPSDPVLLDPGVEGGELKEGKAGIERSSEGVVDMGVCCRSEVLEGIRSGRRGGSGVGGSSRM